MVKLNLGSLSIESTSFEAEGAIPVGFSADGGNRSPGLRWSSVPDGTVELALVMHDPDAPMTDGFTHWVVTGIDPGATGIEEGEPGTGSSVASRATSSATESSVSRVSMVGRVLDAGDAPGIAFSAPVGVGRL